MPQPRRLRSRQVHLENSNAYSDSFPFFYAVYDSANAVPLSAKLKFKLAMRVSADPVTFAGVALMSGIDQAADRPNYVQGKRIRSNASVPMLRADSATLS